MQISQRSTPCHETDDEAEELNLSTPRRRPSCPSELQSDDENISECSGPPKKVTRKAINKTSDDAVPLPDPFPLPTHFGAEVEVALESQKMTNTARIAFIS